MKALTVYRSKYGAAAECAAAISQTLNAGCDVVDLKKSRPNPESYDIVVIGGSIYAGRIQKDVGKYCEKYKEVLRHRVVGCYISCLFADDKAREELEGNYADWLKAHATIMEWFGGNALLSKMNKFDRFLYMKIAGVAEDVRAIRDERIVNFCKALNATSG